MRAVGEICGGNVMCFKELLFVGAVGEICGGNATCFKGFFKGSVICCGVGSMTLMTSVGQNCGEISASRNNWGRKKMRQLVALGTRTSWTTGIWRSIAGKVVLECVKALLMCQETTRGADDESCGRMRIGRPCTVDAWGAVVNRTQFGSVRVQCGSLKERSR